MAASTPLTAPAAAVALAASIDVSAEVWVQLVIGLLTAGIAYFAARAGALSARQSNEAARREEWWRRTQWAIDLALEGNQDRKAVGITALAELLTSQLATEDDLAIGRSVLSQVLDDLPPLAGGDVPVLGHDD